MKRKRGRPQTENLLEGLVNLETGEIPEFKPSPYFPSMKAAAYTLKMDIAILRDARSKDCPAFRSSGHVHRTQLMDWLKSNAVTTTPDAERDLPEAEFEEGGESGGIGHTLKSLQRYERRCKRALDEAEKSNLHPSAKAELVKAKQAAWLMVVNALLKYDLGVSAAKRESGELISLSDAVAGVLALLAWHSMATRDALRNVLPECEGKTKYEIAKLLDPVLRSSIYRNFKTGLKSGDIPEWMGH